MNFLKQTLHYSLFITLIIAISGCGGGLSTSEFFAYGRTDFVVPSKGDILMREGVEKKYHGNYDGALTKWNEATEFYKSRGEEKKLAKIYNLYGEAYLDLNEYDMSFKYFGMSLEISEKIDLKENVVTTLAGIAGVYSKLGDNKKALGYLKKAIDSARGLSNRNGEVEALEGIGNIYLIRKDYGAALEKFKLALSTAKAIDYKKGMQSSYMGVGLALKNLGRHTEALNHFHLALEIARGINDITGIIDALNNIGSVYGELRKYSEALSSFNEGLSISSILNLYFPERNLYAYYSIGSVYKKKGQLLKSIKNFKLAVNEIERIRSRLKAGEHRTGFLENKVVVYEDLIDMLLGSEEVSGSADAVVKGLQRYGKTNVEIAFFYAESTKARTFIESMAKGKQTNIAGRIPKRLADKERQLTARFHSAEGLLSKTGLNNMATDSAKKVFERTKYELEEFIKLLKKDYPDYTAIKYPEPVAVDAVQLKENEVLLEYKVNTDATYLWVVRKGGGPSLIKIGAGREELAKKIQEFRAPLEDFNKINSFDPKRAEELYRLLLKEGIREIDKKTNVIIVPDGPLSILPFEALTADASKAIKQVDPEIGIASYGRIEYIGEQYKISYYPSASVMNVVRRGKSIGDPPKPIFALGDPVYDEEDARYKILYLDKIDKKPERLSTISGARLCDVVVDGGFSLPRLPETSDEILKIGSLFGLGKSSSDIRLGMEANEREVKGAALDTYRYIHFATHGILGGDIPYILEPALVLTQVDNEAEDGFLKMSEVLGLRLNAHMVVLSACKTALGKEVAGEGVVGLSKAFMLAGSNSVLVSLWSVESNSTAALMERFYEYLKSGRPSGEALRLARQEIKEKGYSLGFTRGLRVTSKGKKMKIDTTHPFFWASFIMMGEWK